MFFTDASMGLPAAEADTILPILDRWAPLMHALL